MIPPTNRSRQCSSPWVLTFVTFMPLPPFNAPSVLFTIVGAFPLWCNGIVLHGRRLKKKSEKERLGKIIRL